MKKFTLFSLTIALIIGGCAKNKPIETTVLGMWTNYYLIPATLKGKIKDIKELNFWAIEKDGKITKGELMTKKDLDSIGSTPNFIAHFDDIGILIKHDILDGENVVESSVGIVENGKCIRFDNKVKDTTTYYIIPEYDNLGYLVGANVYKPLVDTITGKYIFSHNSKGNFTKYEYFNYKNQKTGYHVISLDEKGNVLISKYFNKADSLRSTMTNTYSDNGSIIKQQVFNERLKSTETWDYKDLKLDNHDNVIESYANVNNGKYKIFVERSFIYY